MGIGALLMLATYALFLLESMPTSSSSSRNRGVLYSQKEEKMGENGSNSLPYLDCKPLLLLSCVGCSKESPPPRCCNALRMALSHHINTTRISTRGSGNSNSSGSGSSNSGGVSSGSGSSSSGGSTNSGGVVSGSGNSSGSGSGNSSGSGSGNSVNSEVDCFCSQIKANLVDRSTYLPILLACGIPQQETSLLSHC